jgi:uncharacterized protein
MAKKAHGHIKHVPQRTCVGCRKVLAKRELIRLVRTPEGIKIDPTGKLAGRGAYLHNQLSCWQNGMKGALANALKCTISEQDRSNLMEFSKTLPSEADNTKE